jgi:hypothetical protein
MTGDMNGMIDDFIEAQVQAEEKEKRQFQRRRAAREEKIRMALLVIARDNEIGGFVKLGEFPRVHEESMKAYRTRIIQLAKNRASTFLARVLAHRLP